jgi:hypothetical protein
MEQIAGFSSDKSIRSLRDDRFLPRLGDGAIILFCEVSMSSSYEKDVVAWANEQAALLRAGTFNLLDIEHIADEVEDVGKSEKRVLATRMSLLLAHLIKWQFQPERRGKSWRSTIKIQRKAIAGHLRDVPSLKPSLTDPRWVEGVWNDAVAKAIEDTGLSDEDFPEVCPWVVEDLLDPDFLPE